MLCSRFVLVGGIVVLLLVAGPAQADILYTQDFTANDGSVSTSGASLGADYSGWTYQAISGSGSATTDGSGVLKLSTLDSPKVLCADITASQVAGTSTFNVSQNALTVSALVSGNETAIDFGCMMQGLFIGSGRVGVRYLTNLSSAWVSGILVLSDGTNLSGNQTWMGPATSNDTFYRLSLTVKNNPSDSSSYLFDYTMATANSSTSWNYATNNSGNWLSVAKATVGALDRVSLGAKAYTTNPQDGVDAKFSQLSITQTPEPSMIVLLGTGLMGLLACAWRRHK